MKESCLSCRSGFIMCPCISVCPLFMIAFRMSSWPAPASTQTAFPPVTHPEEAEKDLHLNICIGASKLSTETSLSRISTISNVRRRPPLISSHVTYLSHTTKLSLWASHSHSDYHLEPKQSLSSLGLRKCLWMGESLSLSASSSSDARTHPGNLSQEQGRMLFTGNFATKSITWGWIFFHYFFHNFLSFHFHEAIYTDKNLHYKTIDIGLSLHLYKTGQPQNCLCVYIVGTFNIFHGYTPAQNSFKILY